MMHATCEQALQADLGPVELCFAGHPDWTGDVPAGISLTEQGSGDLGERLASAADRVIGEGDKLLLIGTDCPDLDARRLEAAGRSLRTHDAMLHPTVDGGYALLGLGLFDPCLFAGIAWSTASVAADTIARIEALGWSLEIGEVLRDIDEPEDLGHLAPLPAKRSHP
jgi:uncharacterized protein